MWDKSLEACFASVRGGTIPRWWTHTNRAVTVASIIMGMAFLHSNKTLHGNLRPSNIFLCERGRAYVGDCMMAKFAEYGIEKKSTSPMYEAPENVRSEKSDVYSFGMILYEIIAEKPPYDLSLDADRILKSAASGLRPQIPLDAPESARTVISRCWAVNAASRPSFASILSEMESSGFCIFKDVDRAGVQAFLAEIRRRSA
jgi:serine/threonine protein kinase